MNSNVELNKLTELIIHTQDITAIENALVGIHSINDVDVLNHTPLYYCVTLNTSPLVLNIIIRAGAKVNYSHIVDAVIHNKNPKIAIALYHQLTPLHQRDLDYLFLLSCSHRTDFDLLTFFVNEGASLEATLGIDLYPDWEEDLEWLGEVNDEVMVEQNAIVLALYENPSPLKIIKKLIELKVDVNYIDSVGNSILSHALDDLPLLKILIEEGNADIHIKDALGKTPLMSACEGENIEVSLYLIEQERELDKVSKEGKTALHYALCCHLCNNYQVVVSLITRGADINKEDMDGNTPLEIAMEHFAHSEIVRFLEEKVAHLP